MSLGINAISKTYGTTPVLHQISLNLEHGRVLTLLGPSGCGKTTLLRIIAGLDQATTGSLELDGTRLDTLPPFKRGIGMVFQNYALWPHMTVFQNLAYPLKVKGVVAQKDIECKVQEKADLVGLGALLNRYPNQLSGGQQQRVALARALAMEPKILLLDEPLSNLDAKLREQMRRELRELQQRIKMTMVYVTHDRLEALELSDTMAILDQGHLVQAGSPAEIRANPVNDFVAGFING